MALQVAGGFARQAKCSGLREAGSKGKLMRGSDPAKLNPGTAILVRGPTNLNPETPLLMPETTVLIPGTTILV
jgi:hypothetical protein